MRLALEEPTFLVRCAGRQRSGRVNTNGHHFILEPLRWVMKWGLQPQRLCPEPRGAARLVTRIKRAAEAPLER